MTKALIKGELDKEFRNLSRTGNYKTTSKDKTKSLTEFLPTNRHGVKKALKRLKSDKNRSNTLKSVKNKKQKKADSNSDDIDHTNENVQRLLEFSKDSELKGLSNKNILDHTNKLKRHYEPKSRSFLKNLKPKKKTESVSIFSEQDFETFQNEYFLNSEPINKTTLLKKSEKE